ncbi:unnamed protein product [Cuscuta campestris]|uniref:CCHC-type domain-containing protein n=1 Tax=Cuscuta campestris TaxID=132261 RepID=A0A484LMR0_9ASTE|nr:unnamed protein product [Cuscuta campestris]
MALALNKLLPDLFKLEPLDRKNYRRWSQNMLIFFEQLEVDYVLFEDAPTDFVEDTNTTHDSTAAIADAAATKAVAAPEKSKRTPSKDKAKGDDQAKRKSKGNFSGSFKSNKKSFKKPGNKNFKNHGGQIQKKNNSACFVCGKIGHKASCCFKRFDNNKDGNVHHNPQVNVVEHDDIITAVVSEVNMVENHVEWIVDTGTMFVEFDESAEIEVFMGNSNSADVLGKGKVLLKLTSGKSLSLSNVFNVPSLRRNLISGALLNKAGIKLVFEADKLVLTRNGEYVGKGYLSGGLFALDVSVNNMNKASTSAYIAESIDLWHGQEVEWLRNLLADIPLWGKPAPPISRLCDSQAAISVAKNKPRLGGPLDLMDIQIDL